MDVIGERALPVDLDDRQPLAVARLELGIAADVDFVELERNRGPHLVKHRPRPLAEATAGRDEQRDLRYGYRPRVVVASATRCTASP
jgi:hypothetical protein